MNVSRYTGFVLTLVAVLLAANLWISLGGSKVHAYESGHIQVVKWDSNGTIRDVSSGSINGQIVALSCPSFNSCVALVR